MSAGPCTPITSAGRLSTSVVVINWPPLSHAGGERWVQACPCGTDGGHDARRAGAQDQEFVVRSVHAGVD